MRRDALLERCVCGEPLFRHRTVGGRQIACEDVKRLDRALGAIRSSAQLGLPPMDLQGESGRESSPQPRWLTTAIATVIHAERGTVKRIALALGVTDKAVYDVADINSPRPLKAGWIPDICRETGSHVLLDVLEAQCGRVAFTLPPTTVSDADVLRQGAAVMQESADVVRVIASTAADRIYTPAEAAIVRREGEQAIRTILGALAHVDARTALAERRA